MREILISIKEKWAELIFAGKKSVELRKSRPNGIASNCYDRAYICYDGKIHGYIIVKHYLSIDEEAPCSTLEERACVTSDELRAYSPKYEWLIFSTFRFETPIALSYIGVKRSPQSWQYISRQQSEKVMKGGKA